MLYSSEDLAWKDAQIAETAAFIARQQTRLQDLRPGEAPEGAKQALEAAERMLAALQKHRRLIARFLPMSIGHTARPWPAPTRNTI